MTKRQILEQVRKHIKKLEEELFQKTNIDIDIECVILKEDDFASLHKQLEIVDIQRTKIDNLIKFDRFVNYNCGMRLDEELPTTTRLWRKIKSII